MSHLLELYRTTALELPRAAIFLVDRDYRYVLAGGEGLASAGRSPADFEGRALADVIPAEALPQALLDYEAVFQNHTFTREHAVGDRVFQSHGKLVPQGVEPAAQYALVVSYDITERKQSEARLQLIGAVGETVRRAASVDAVITAIAKLLYMHLNITGVFFGDVSATATGDGWLPGLSCEATEDSVHNTSLSSSCLPHVMREYTPRAEQASDAVLRYSHLDQALEVKVDATVICPHIDATGLKGVFAALHQGSTRDWLPAEVTLLEAIASIGWQFIDRHRQLQQLHDASVQQNRFLAVLGHELRNPLSAIQSALDLIRLTNLPQHTERAHKVVAQQFLQINRLMEDLAAISQSNHGGDLILKREALDISALVDQSVRAMRHTADAKNHTVTVTLLTAPLVLSIDRVRITQVVNNLLSNAIKYTPPGGMIDVALTENVTDVEIRVTDNGIGMTAETLSATFDIFGRGREALAQAQDGLGVGMWLAKKFVEAHGGSINAHSDGAGMGSSVVVSLPHSGANGPLH